MKKRYYILGLAGALLYASSSLAGVAFIEGGEKPVYEPDTPSANISFEEKCDPSTFNLASKLTHAECKSCQGSSGTKYSCTCQEGYEMNVIKGECEAKSCEEFPILQSNINDKAGPYECQQCGDETKCRYTNCNDGWTFKEGECHPQTCDTNIYPLTEAPGTSCTDPTICQAGDTHLFGCDQCAEGYKLTSAQKCVPSDETEEDIVLDCPEGYQADGVKGCLPKTKLDCKVGYIYYSDDTCSPDKVEGKTPIGIVYDETNRLVMALDAPDKEPGNIMRFSVSKGLFNSAKTDMLGEDNSNIFKYFKEDSHWTGTIGAPATEYCLNKQEGHKIWYLPALGEMLSWKNNFDVINKGLAKVGGTALQKTNYVSSTRGGGNTSSATPSWVLNIGDNVGMCYAPQAWNKTAGLYSYEEFAKGGDIKNVSTTYLQKTRCVFSYGARCELGYERDATTDTCKRKKYAIGDIVMHYGQPLGIVFYDDGKTTKMMSITNHLEMSEEDLANLPKKDTETINKLIQEAGIKAYPEDHRWDSDTSLAEQEIKNALQDMDGKKNTEVLAEASIYPAIVAKNYSPKVCEYAKSPICGKGKWYLPALGELENIRKNIDAIQAAASKLYDSRPENIKGATPEADILYMQGEVVTHICLQSMGSVSSTIAGSLPLSYNSSNYFKTWNYRAYQDTLLQSYYGNNIYNDVPSSTFNWLCAALEF